MSDYDRVCERGDTLITRKITKQTWSLSINCITRHFPNKAELDSRNDKLHLGRKIPQRVSLFIFKIYRLTESAKYFFSRLHCMCQHLQITLFSLILSFHLNLMPLKRFHLGDVSFCLEQIQMPIRHTHCGNEIRILYNQYECILCSHISCKVYYYF